MNKIEELEERSQKYFNWYMEALDKIDTYRDYIIEKNYQFIYDKYCELYPEEINSDFLLEEDGNEVYIDDIIDEYILDIKEKEEYIIPEMEDVIESLEKLCNIRGDNN